LKQYIQDDFCVSALIVKADKMFTPDGPEYVEIGVRHGKQEKLYAKEETEKALLS